MACLTQVVIGLTLIFLASAWPALKTAKRSGGGEDGFCEMLCAGDFSAEEYNACVHGCGGCSDYCMGQEDDACFSGCLSKAEECYHAGVDLTDKNAEQDCKLHHTVKGHVDEILKAKKLCSLSKDECANLLKGIMKEDCQQHSLTPEQCASIVAEIINADEICESHSLTQDQCAYGITMCLTRDHNMSAKQCEEWHIAEGRLEATPTSSKRGHSPDARRLASKRAFENWARRFLQRKK